MRKGNINGNLSIELNSAYYVRSKISYYPLSHSILPIPNGMAVVIFKNREDIKEYYEIRGIDAAEELNFEILKVRSLYDFMREMADMGYAGIWYFNNFPILFGNYLSDIDIEIPSFSYTYQEQFIGASGLIDKPEQFYPWVNYSKTDKILRRFIHFQEGVPFDFSEDVFIIVNKLSNDTITHCQFPNASPLQGPYVSDMGVLCIFTEQEYAHRFLQNIESSASKLSIIEIKIDKFLEDKAVKGPFIDIGINPGIERYSQGYFLRDHKRIKTVHGIFELDESLSLKEIDQTDEDSDNDTIDKPNTIDPSLRGFLSTIKNPLKHIVGTTQNTVTKKESTKIITKLINDNDSKCDDMIDEIEPKDISSDSFLVFGFDKISGDPISNNEEMISPFVFRDVFDAILYFYHRHFSSEYDIRFNGFSHCNSGIIRQGTNNEEHEDYILSENREALRELMEMILTQGYKLEHSELLMSYINRSSISLEIEACGYLGDFAFFKESFIEQKLGKDEDENKDEDDEEEQSLISKKILNIVQSYKDKLNSKIDLSDKYQNKIRIYLGSAYENLSLESRCILESAMRQFEGDRKIINHDYAGISMKLCKTFERELKNEFFMRWKKASNINKDTLKKHLNEAETNKDINLIQLIKFLLGRSKLELGSMKFIIERITIRCDHEILISLYDYLYKLKNKSYILSDEFLGHCDQISTRYRNGGVHEKIVSYEICQEAFNNILINKNSYLSMLMDLG